MSSRNSAFSIFFISFFFLITAAGCGSYDEVPLEGEQLSDEEPDVPDEKELAKEFENALDEGPSAALEAEMEERGVPVDQVPFPGETTLDNFSDEEGMALTLKVETTKKEGEDLFDAVVEWYNEALSDEEADLEVSEKSNDRAVFESEIDDISLEITFILYRIDQVEVSLAIEEAG